MQNTFGGRGKFSEITSNLTNSNDLKYQTSIEKSKAEDKASNYVDYLPIDANTESGMSLQNDNNIG